MSELREKLRKARGAEYLSSVEIGDLFKAAEAELDRVEKERDFEQSSRLTSEAQLGTLISNLEAKLAGVEKERDELEFILNEGGTWEAQIQAAEARAEAAEGLIEQAVRALEPFDSVVDAYDYFLPVMMPELNFPVEGTRAADPGFERVLSEADFRLARSTLSLLKASRPRNREETE